MDVEHIYETLLGERLDPYPGVGNAFADGSRCAKLYEEVYHANLRLCDRLGVEEDADVEIIVDRLLEMNRELCLLMFRYGRLLR